MTALTIGDVAPDFTLLSDQNQPVKLSDLHGKNVILFFYPKDDTPGCTREACDFRDNVTQFAAKDADIIGISKDTHGKHQKFKQKYSLPFTLLTDPNGDVCEAYGVINKKNLFGNTFLGIQRSTFLIDKNGMIQAIWRKVTVKDHALAVLESLT